MCKGNVATWQELREEYSQDLVLPTVVKSPVERAPVLIHQSASAASVSSAFVNHTVCRNAPFIGLAQF